MARRSDKGRLVTQSETRAELRGLFLRLAVELSPTILSALRDTVPLYARAVTESAEHGGPDCLLRWSAIAGVRDTAAARERYRHLLALKEGLEAWSRAYFHLKEPVAWVQDAALLQLSWWHANPSRVSDARTWAVRGGSMGPAPPEVEIPAAVLEVPHAVFTAPEEVAKYEREALAALKSFRAALETRVARARERIESLQAEALQADEGLWERETVLRELQRHVGWVVRAQVMREEWDTIAAATPRTFRRDDPEPDRMAPVQPTTVSQKVHELADDMGLPLNPVKSAGRPPGSQTKHTSGVRVTKGRQRR